MQLCSPLEVRERDAEIPVTFRQPVGPNQRHHIMSVERSISYFIERPPIHIKIVHRKGNFAKTIAFARTRARNIANRILCGTDCTIDPSRDSLVQKLANLMAPIDVSSKLRLLN
jgi:hypothetical protein